MSQENVEIVRGVRYRVSLPSERASQRRLMEERFFVRFPTLFRLFTDAWMRLPPRSRVRRLLLTRLMQRGFAATNRRDFDLLVTGLDREIESRPPRSKMGGLIAPTWTKLPTAVRATEKCGEPSSMPWTSGSSPRSSSTWGTRFWPRLSGGDMDWGAVRP